MKHIHASRALVILLALVICATTGTGAYVAVTQAHADPSAPMGEDARAAARPSPPPARLRSHSDIPPLRRIVQPTVAVVASRSISGAQMRRIRHMAAVRELTAFDAGRVRVMGAPANMFGVDPDTFRAWTPPPTASSKRLWRAIARGEMGVSRAAQQVRNLRVGQPYVVTGQHLRQLTLGGTAEFGLPGVDAIVSSDTGRALGLVPNLGVLISAPGADVDKLERSLRRLLGKHTQVLRPAASPAEQEGRGARSAERGKPRTYEQLYRQAAARCPGLSWSVLAAIGQIESAHGRNVGPSSAGALGPMQFLPSTWRRYGLDGDGDGRADVMNPYDAVPSAVQYLCAHGAGSARGTLRQAVYAYNHAWWYVREVLALARRYA